MQKSKIHEAIILTGPSGAGKTTAINVLEDIGFEPIDNIPIDLIGRVLSGADLVKPLALGIDVRTRGFSAKSLLEAIDSLRTMSKQRLKLLYLDCTAFELEKRFNGTRRKHPLSSGDTLTSAIFRESKAIEPLKTKADILLDTSDLNPNQLKTQLIKCLNLELQNHMSVHIQSLAYTKPMPPSIDMLIDCRFLSNPHWIPELKELTGQNSEVGRQIEKDKNWREFYRKTVDLLEFLLPRYKEAGKTYFSIGFGCSGGRHRSVYVANKVTQKLRMLGWTVTLDHKELETNDNR